MKIAQTKSIVYIIKFINSFIFEKYWKTDMHDMIDTMSNSKHLLVRTNTAALFERNQNWFDKQVGMCGIQTDGVSFRPISRTHWDSKQWAGALTPHLGRYRRLPRAHAARQFVRTILRPQPTGPREIGSHIPSPSSHEWKANGQHSGCQIECGETLHLLRRQR